MALEFPSHDPHGAPIPTPGGQIEETDFFTLADAAPGAKVKIRAVRDEDSARLRSMEAKGLVPGACLHVETKQRAPEVVTVRVGATDSPCHGVRQDLARRIYVVPVEG